MPSKADNLRRRSPYTTGLFGAHVTDLPLTVVDDPGIDEGYGSYTLDDEGVLAARTTLVADGHVVGTLHGRRSARAGNTGPSGHGRGAADRVLAAGRVAAAQDV